MLDAQMVLDELLAAGLKARISGAHLSGAVGELPPSELLSVWIESEHHYDRARQIVDAFEATQQMKGADKPCHRCREMLAPQFGQCWNCGASQEER